MKRRGRRVAWTILPAWGAGDLSSNLSGPISPFLTSKGGESVKFTKYEKARIIGARALQLSMGAPPLIRISEDMQDPIVIAIRELEKGVIPITVRRRMPEKKLLGEEE